MVGFAKANYSKVIIVFQLTNPMELGELEHDEGVDAILWVGFPGSTGFNSLANIIKGTVDPFGYGLSYTTFQQKNVSVDRAADGTYQVVVEVSNTGSVAGKDAVELYFTPPYDPAEGIEKAEVDLLAFEKTGDIAPGASAQVTLRFAEEDMASYDYKTAGCYVLSGGAYILSVREDAHTAFDSVEVEVSASVYDESGPRTSDEVPAVNRFDDVSAMFTDTQTDGYVRNMPRSDFAGTFPQAPDDHSEMWSGRSRASSWPTH